MRRSTYSSYSTSSSKNGLKWLGAIIIFGGFIALIFYATSHKDALRDENNLEIVQPLAGAVKVRADNPGGMEVANRDKQVFDLLEEGGEEIIEEESLCDSEKGAMLCNKELPKVAQLAADPKIAEQAREQSKNQPKSADIAMLIQDYDNKEKATKTQSVELKKALVQPIQPQEAVEKNQELNGIYLKQDKKKIAEQKPTLEKAPQEKLFTGGAWGVQLASYKSLETADRGAKIFLKKFPDLLKDLTYVTEKIDIEGKGTFYRVQFIGLKDKTSAQKACEAFKAQKQGCWYVSR